MIHAVWIHRDGNTIDAVYTGAGWRVRLAMIKKHGGRVLSATSLTLEAARDYARQKGALHGS